MDIAHEALIGGWPTLRGWVSERREAEQTRRRMEAKADEWVRLGRGDGGLLDAAELPEAGAGSRAPRPPTWVNSEDFPALVKASRRTIEHNQHRSSRGPPGRAAQAQSLADEQRRRVRTLRRSLMVAGVLLMVAAGAALWARHETVLANEQPRRRDITA